MNFDFEPVHGEMILENGDVFELSPQQVNQIRAIITQCKGGLYDTDSQTAVQAQSRS
jgi:hypothetical protein